MRLFLKEKQLYASILRWFPPEIFPGMLVAFAKVLEAAIAEMDRRFREGGSKGLEPCDDPQTLALVGAHPTLDDHETWFGRGLD
jgi:hypothetical protein